MSEIYAIIPVSKVGQYISVDFQYGRFSLDGKFLVWDQDWDEKVLEKMKSDPEVKLLTYGEALEEMGKEEWSLPMEEII